MEELIKECERLKEKDGENYFIFDKKTTNAINLHFSNSDTQLKRDVIIEQLIGTDLYCIGDLSDLYKLPSREIFYDTETKESCKYKRYKKVIDFILSIGTEASTSNIGQEYEQSFIINGYVFFYKFTVKPNCFIEISFFGPDGKKTIYNEFYNKNKILNILSKRDDISIKSGVRNAKIENILKFE